MVAAAIPTRGWETRAQGVSIVEVFLMAVLLVVLLEGFAWGITALRHAARRHREAEMDRKFKEITRDL